jgi:hypothetical protein
VSSSWKNHAEAAAVNLDAALAGDAAWHQIATHLEDARANINKAIGEHDSIAGDGDNDDD